MIKKLDAFVNWINCQNEKIRNLPKIEVTTTHKDYYTRPLSTKNNGLGTLKVMNGGKKSKIK